tara:strand:+ start:372 stop:1100 length:729 start_codon:yes stop_codon:yes gene_type:complete
MTKIIGVLMTFNCEKVVEKAINKIPKDKLYKLICTDDGSTDKTVEIVKSHGIEVVENEHFGYGANLFSGMKKAFDMGATHVAEIHGDGQYDYNQIQPLKERFDNNADLVLGDRFYDMKQPLRDGMPLFIYVGNIFLSLAGRILLSLNLGDLFPGFRGYSKKFFEEMKGAEFSNDYKFSFEIIARSKYKNLNIVSVPVRCDYKSEHHTAPISKAFPIIFNVIYTGLAYRFNKFNIKLRKNLFK